MKTMTKKLGAIILALAMCFSLCATALAASEYIITIENATIGQSYSAYKIFDATYDKESDAVTYTISSTSPLFSAIQSSGVFTLTQIGTSDEYYVTTTSSGEAINAALKNIGIEDLVGASDTVVASSTTVTLDVGEAGYYYITSELGSEVTIDTAHPTATVIDKNETVGGDKFQKYVVDENGNETSYGDAAMGDTLNFDITSNVPLYEGDNIVLEYVFTDTLADNGMEIEIEVEPTDGSHHINIENGHYYADDDLINKFVTMTDSSDQTYNLSDVAYNITLEFTNVREETIVDEETGEEQTWVVCGGFILTYYTYDVDAYDEDGTFDTSKYLTDLTIDIEYSTYVTDNANHYETNNVELKYYTTKFSNPDPKDPQPAEEQYSSDTIYSWDLELVKVDGTDSTRHLEGAEFTLVGDNLNHVQVSTSVTYTEIDKDEMVDGVTYYYKTIDGRYITTAPAADGSDAGNYDPDNPGPYTRTVDTTLEKAKGEDSVTITGKTDSDGSLIFDGLTEGTYTLTEITAPGGYNLLSSPIVFTVAFDSTTGTFNITSIDGLENSNVTFDENNEVMFTIENNSGSELPSTGGIGTTIFYIIGGVLVAGAVVVLITRRRMSSAD